MVSYRDIAAGLSKLEIPRDVPVFMLSNLDGLGEVRGGHQSVLGAMLANFPALMTPSFTYNTIIVPEDGPENNALEYGSKHDDNLNAEFFLASMPADKSLGTLPNMLCQHVQANRSLHPILSFCGVGVDDALETQTLEEPLSPIMVLNEQNGWVVLFGVDQTANVSIHVAEHHSGRKTFTRWALTTHGIFECPNFPGCAQGFNKLDQHLPGIHHQTTINDVLVKAIPLREIMHTASAAVRENPLALLCENPQCPECNAIRADVLNTN